MKLALKLSRSQVRRLALRSQRLAGARPAPDSAGLLELVRALGCVQIDPISVVDRTQHLVVFSRIGAFDRETLRRLQEEERALFEYWAHAASLVLTEDLPIHRCRMQRAFGDGRSGTNKARDWLTARRRTVREVLAELEERGPLRAQDLRHHTVKPWESGRWTNGKSVAILLEVLSELGEVLVSRREGNTRWWDVGRRCLPPDAPLAALPEEEAVRRAIVRSVRALGAATPTQIKAHFTRGRYPSLENRLAELVADDALVPATVDGLLGVWYVHSADVTSLDDLPIAETTLLSPFDNLVCDRSRTEALWDYRFRIEIYTPPAKREYGYYVLPVLEGERLIGRIDAAADRKRAVLVAKQIHVEPGIRLGRERSRSVRRALERLATFTGCEEVEDAQHALRR